MIYFDNAATTPVDKEVIETMYNVLKNEYGNPSSVHEPGRRSRVIIEDARRQVAGYLNAKPSEIFFTSCGTEALNTALWGCVNDLGIKHVITSAIEHHAVTHTLEVMKYRDLVEVHHVKLMPLGYIDMNDLEENLKQHKNALVCLMNANNEIGNLLPLDKVATLCKTYGTYFLTDTVQTIGKYRIDLGSIPVHFATCSAHKFHGPKGIGFLYIRNGIFISPLLTGGGQERQMRSGTENIQGIAGLAKAMEVAHRDMDAITEHVTGLKQYMAAELRNNIPGIGLNGDTEKKGLYGLLNVSFPKTAIADMLLQRLDMMGIFASGGSACTSGAVSESPVLKAIGADMERPAIRFSFSKYNTRQEVDECIRVLKEILAGQ